jgi:benzodiazapine receptor
MRAVLSFLVFLLLVAGASAFGAGFPPGSWYAALIKPPLNPPNWLFGPVWSILYLSIATAGWLMVPYALWVGFAAYLNAGLWYMNR